MKYFKTNDDLNIDSHVESLNQNVFFGKAVLNSVNNGCYITCRTYVFFFTKVQLPPCLMSV